MAKVICIFCKKEMEGKKCSCGASYKYDKIDKTFRIWRKKLN